MGDDQHGAGKFAEVLFEPRRRFGIEMVGRFGPEQQQVFGLLAEAMVERHMALLAT